MIIEGLIGQGNIVTNASGWKPRARIVPDVTMNGDGTEADLENDATGGIEGRMAMTGIDNTDIIDVTREAGRGHPMKLDGDSAVEVETVTRIASEGHGRLSTTMTTTRNADAMDVTEKQNHEMTQIDTDVVADLSRHGTESVLCPLDIAARPIQPAPKLHLAVEFVHYLIDFKAWRWKLLRSYLEGDDTQTPDLY